MKTKELKNLIYESVNIIFRKDNNEEVDLGLFKEYELKGSEILDNLEVVSIRVIDDYLTLTVRKEAK